MTLNPDSLIWLQEALLGTAAALAIAKISRQCSAEGLRRRLGALELELFEFARQGRIGFRDPAYLLLRNSLRSIAWAAEEFSLTRTALAAFLGRDFWRSANLQCQAAPWDDARGRLADRHAAEAVAGMHQRMLRLVHCYLALGAIPFAPWLCQVIGRSLAGRNRRPAPLCRARALAGQA
ncbi:MAG: hypothetical protein OXD30_08520 [Bryobacterales bacterium]|nr:hypothetical protein [Bryobacterales bacterium]